MGRSCRSGTRVYVPVASYCDKPDADGYFADGRLVAVDVIDRSHRRDVRRRRRAEQHGRHLGLRGRLDRPVDWPPLDGHRQLVGTSTRSATASSRRPVTERASSSWMPISTSSPGTGPRACRIVEDNDFGAAPLLFQPPAARRWPLRTRRTVASTSGRARISAGGRSGAPASGRSDLDASFISQPSYSPDLNMFFISAARDYDDEGQTRTLDAVVALQGRPRLHASRAADLDGARRRARPEVAAR